MTATTADPAPPPSHTKQTEGAGLVPQLSMMIGALFASPLRNRLLLLGCAVFLVVVATTYGQILLNRWNAPFYDALSRRDLGAFLEQLGVFAKIAGALLVLNVAQRWLNEMAKLKLREGLVHDLLEQWLKPRRAFRLANAGPIGLNPDQRMHEDARHLTELSADLGIGLLQSSILLISFVSVLWALSSGFQFHFAGHAFVIHGYMVWAAVIYAGSASLASYWMGRRLIAQNSDRYAREADFRFSLMRVNEHIDSISLFAGEADEKRRIDLDLDAVLRAMRRLVGGLTRLTWVTSGYGWFTLVAPILVAAPVYFSGGLTFGGLMMAVGAFNQVQASLRWFVDNFSTIADWRATLLRVASFRREIVTADLMHKAENQIQFVDGHPGRLTIRDLEIASPAGCTKLSETDVTVASGERVLIVGEPGAGKTLLFRALAGLWCWGAGTISWPKGEEVLYLPRRPYLPPGTLREVLAYPAEVSTFEENRFPEALSKLGLGRLIPMLDMAARWDHELGDDEQQALSFARVLIHDPRWLLIDEVLESLDEDMNARIAAVLMKDLPRTGIINVGRPQLNPELFPRVLHLIRDPQARTLTRAGAAEIFATPARRPETGLVGA